MLLHDQMSDAVADVHADTDRLTGAARTMATGPDAGAGSERSVRSRPSASSPPGSPSSPSTETPHRARQWPPTRATAPLRPSPRTKGQCPSRGAAWSPACEKRCWPSSPARRRRRRTGPGLGVPRDVRAARADAGVRRRSGRRGPQRPARGHPRRPLRLLLRMDARLHPSHAPRGDLLRTYREMQDPSADPAGQRVVASSSRPGATSESWPRRPTASSRPATSGTSPGMSRCSALTSWPTSSRRTGRASSCRPGSPRRGRSLTPYQDVPIRLYKGRTDLLEE